VFLTIVNTVYDIINKNIFFQLHFLLYLYNMYKCGFFIHGNLVWESIIELISVSTFYCQWDLTSEV